MCLLIIKTLWIDTVLGQIMMGWICLQLWSSVKSKIIFLMSTSSVNKLLPDLPSWGKFSGGNPWTGPRNAVLTSHDHRLLSKLQRQARNHVRGIWTHAYTINNENLEFWEHSKFLLIWTQNYLVVYYYNTRKRKLWNNGTKKKHILTSTSTLEL